MRIAAVEMNPLDEDADAELDQPLSKFKVLAKLGMLVDDRAVGTYYKKPSSSFYILDLVFNR